MGRFRRRFPDVFFDVFFMPLGSIFDNFWDHFWEQFESTSHPGAKNMIFTKCSEFQWILNVIFGVSESQNGDLFGPEGDFFDVRKRGRFLHRFWTPKVTKMSSKWRPKRSKNASKNKVEKRCEKICEKVAPGRSARPRG